jgi:two-component system, NtrC family, sensor histidine kinase KinB
MTLKKKLILGLGFLFLIIFGLAIVSSYEIGELSRDAENILKDNYKSLVYSRNMLAALEETRTAVSGIVFDPVADGRPSEDRLKLFETGKAEFERNLALENGNITEVHEGEFVAEVNREYALYAGLCLRLIEGEGGRALYFGEYQPALDKLTRDIQAINDLNMQAVERKSRTAKEDSVRIIRLVALIGVFGLILAFGYFWYFPFYVSNSIAYLAEKMKALLDKSGIPLDIRTNDEAFILLQGITLLENKLDKKPLTPGRDGG